MLITVRQSLSANKPNSCDDNMSILSPVYHVYMAGKNKTISSYERSIGCRGNDIETNYSRIRYKPVICSNKSICRDQRHID